MIPVAKPYITEQEKKIVMEVLSSGALAQGEWVSKFEQKFAKFIGTKYAIATSNGTSALHLSLMALGIKQDDEVITTPFTFIASANAIIYVGAKPVFVDIDEQTFNINPDLIEAKITPKTRAILPVHLYGLPAEMNKIMNIAKKYNLYVIEDACQAHGARVRGQNAGSIGDVGCFSFYPTKNMTTGEGGMVTTDNLQIAEKIYLLRGHGMKVRYQYVTLGYNYRMTNIAAAIGLSQLKKLPSFNRIRVKNAQKLYKGLSNIKGIVITKTPNEIKHVFHQFTVRITSDYKHSRTKLIEYLSQKGIDSSIYYPTPLHKQKVYIDLGYKDSLPVSEKLADEVLSLPVHPLVSEEDLEFIIKTIKEFS